ncbi:MAG: cbb3-type cytochrome oxidase assembly protein CcoS [Panacagrimonas sp.]
MESLFLLVPLGLIVVFGAAVLYVRAACGGQFEDMARYQQQLPDDS